VLAVAALAIPAAFAGNSSANKVNGDLWFTNNSGPAHWVFNAQDLAAGDKGSLTYEDAYGIYNAVVTDAVVEDGNATFTAKITSSTIGYANVNDTFTWTVYDSGTGVSETSDSFTFNRMTLMAMRPSSTRHCGSPSRRATFRSTSTANSTHRRGSGHHARNPRSG
jgi:hypothetical protein